MLGIERCKPFEELNLGRYERQCWLVSDLPTTLTGNVREVRREIGALHGGEVRLVPDEAAGELVARVSISRIALAAECLGIRAYIRVGSGGVS